MSKRRSQRHVVRRLPDGRMVCKTCPFTSMSDAEAVRHVLMKAQRYTVELNDMVAA